MNFENIEPYANFAHIASIHGGIDNYLSEIAKENFKLGVLRERSITMPKIILFAGVAILIWEGGKWIYRKSKALCEQCDETNCSCPDCKNHSI